MLNVNPYAQGAVYICKLYADDSNLAVYKKSRPVIIMNAINIAEDIVMVAPTTTQPNINGVKVMVEDNVNSTIVLEKMFPVHTCYLERFIGILTKETMDEVFYAMDILYGRLHDVSQEDIDKYFPNRCEFSVRFSNRSIQNSIQKENTTTALVVKKEAQPIVPLKKTSPKIEPNVDMFCIIKPTTYNEILSIVKTTKPERYTDVLNNPKYTSMVSRMSTYEKENQDIIINGIMNNLTIADIYDVINSKRKETVESVISIEETKEEKKEEKINHKKYVRINLNELETGDLIWIQNSTTKDIMAKYDVSITTATKYKTRSTNILNERGCNA